VLVVRVSWCRHPCLATPARHGAPHQSTQRIPHVLLGRASRIGFVYIGPRFRQIVPVWIHRFDQANLLASTPSLDFFLAIDRRVGIDEAFVIDEAGEVVTAREAGDEFVFVLEGTMGQVAGDAGVQDMGARSVRHDVNIEALGLEHGVLPSSSASSRA
jgi:hypothetical protein